MLRPDEKTVLGRLTEGWPLFATHQATPSGMAPWPPSQPLRPEVTSVWAAHPDLGAWAFQLLLLETEGDRWVFRRDREVGGPIDGLG